MSKWHLCHETVVRIVTSPFHLSDVPATMGAWHSLAHEAAEQLDEAKMQRASMYILLLIAT